MTRNAPKLLVASLLLSPLLALAAVPQTISFSARIADSGQPVTGSQSFTFVLWNDANAGTAVWTEGPRSIPVNDGVVVTSLGDVANGGTTLPPFDGPLWLEVTMGTATFPRIALQTVPYAFHAAVADSLTTPPAAGVGAGAASSFTSTETVLASKAVTIPAPGAVMVIGEASFNNSTLNNWLNCWMREDGLNTAAGSTFFYWDAGDVDGFYDQAQTRTWVKPVTAGAHTYTLSCNSSSGSVLYTYPQVVVAYFPASL